MSSQKKTMSFLGPGLLATILVTSFALSYYQFGVLGSEAAGVSEVVKISPQITNITMAEGAFDPQNKEFFTPAVVVVVIGVNNTVKWTNKDRGVVHTVSSDGGFGDFDRAAHASNYVGQGDVFTNTFAKVGEFTYHCTPHPWMKGKIVVQKGEVVAKAVKPVTVRIALNSLDRTNKEFFVPPTMKVVIGVNNTVTWVNEDKAPHTVTSDGGYEDFDKAATAQNNIEPGKAWSYTFTKPGTYNYHSESAPWMKGSIIVSKA